MKAISAMKAVTEARESRLEVLLQVSAYWQGSLDFSIRLQHKGNKFLHEPRQYQLQSNTLEFIASLPMVILAVLQKNGTDFRVDPHLVKRSRPVRRFVQ